MYWIRFPVLLLFLIPLVDADSAVQTDWSGGSGILGPILDWSNQFYQSLHIDWSGYPGSLLSQSILEHTVDGNFIGACAVYSEDIDGDGDMDVLGAAQGDWDITWWENIDGLGISWTKHTIGEDFDGARSVYSEDIDGDGDKDVLGAANIDDDITWWENEDGSGTSWIEHTIDGDFKGATSVYSEDIDGDGDKDVLGAAWGDFDITWWENSDTSPGMYWAEHTIDGDFLFANSVYSEDIDGDGDMDALGASLGSDDDITWWENENGLGTSWIEHTIEGDFNGAFSVYSEDIDGDGDLDVLGAAQSDDDITWWENEDGLGTSWIEHTIDGDFDYACSVYSEDVDGDGDMDVLGAAHLGSDFTWWENEDGLGTSWTEHNIDGDFLGAFSVYSEDIDGDGDMDVLGAATYADDITWWDLTRYSPEGSLESSILDTQLDPDWNNLDWNSQTPPGTFISFQVRASDDHTAMGVWSDTLTSPCLLTGILNDGDRYMQYRVILSTSDPDTTPVLNDVMITWDPLGVGDDPQVTEYLLHGAKPNPARGVAHIDFAVPVLSQVELSIFDLAGHLVATPVQREYSPGVHEVQINELTPGVYFCRMVSGDFTATQRIVVIE